MSVIKNAPGNCCCGAAGLTCLACSIPAYANLSRTASATISGIVSGSPNMPDDSGLNQWDGSPRLCDMSTNPQGLSTADLSGTFTGSWTLNQGFDGKVSCYLPLWTVGITRSETQDGIRCDTYEAPLGFPWPADVYVDGFQYVFEAALASVSIFAPGHFPDPPAPYPAPAVGDYRLVAGVAIRSIYRHGLLTFNGYDGWYSAAPSPSPGIAGTYSYLNGYVDQSTPFNCAPGGMDVTVTLANRWSDPDISGHWLNLVGASLRVQT